MNRNLSIILIIALNFMTIQENLYTLIKDAGNMAVKRMHLHRVVICVETAEIGGTIPICGADKFVRIDGSPGTSWNASDPGFRM